MTIFVLLLACFYFVSSVSNPGLSPAGFGPPILMTFEGESGANALFSIMTPMLSCRDAAAAPCFSKEICI